MAVDSVSVLLYDGADWNVGMPLNRAFVQRVRSPVR